MPTCVNWRSSSRIRRVATLLAAADLDPRRVAAWALVDLAHYAHLLPSTPERLQTIARVIEAANIGLTIFDGDEFVRGYCLLAALTQSATRLMTINGFNKQDRFSSPEERKRIPLDESFLAVFAQYQAISGKLQNAEMPMQDRRRFNFTALEATRSELLARAGLLRNLRDQPGNQNIDARKLLIANVKKDPMQGIIEGNGQTIAALLGNEVDVRVRRRAMAVLDLMGEDLRFFERGSETALTAVTASLTNRKGDLFVRLSAMDVVEKLLFRSTDFTPQLTDDMPEKDRIQEQQRIASNKENAKIVLQKLLAHRIDVILIDLLMNADTQRTVTPEEALAAAYADPDLSRAAATVLNIIGDMATAIGSDDRSRAPLREQPRRPVQLRLSVDSYGIGLWQRQSVRCGDAQTDHESTGEHRRHLRDRRLRWAR